MACFPRGKSRRFHPDRTRAHARKRHWPALPVRQCEIEYSSRISLLNCQALVARCARRFTIRMAGTEQAQFERPTSKLPSDVMWCEVEERNCGVEYARRPAAWPCRC